MMKQLNVDASPPANIMTLRLGFTHVTLTLTHVTFDLEQYQQRWSNET